ncbi:hypothetical protein EYF80_050835 [Liparis tanakae]|uniref:Uncharacterized protein n=1 Tax=Liparis tanakae TaxID=230148 RepID=A0A4Z2FDM3_9TELE|nr:hypothetical protein EYF80_050835 [Liparis tanakae]
MEGEPSRGTMRLKLDTMTGTGSAITSTPLSEQMEPKIFPAMVLGTISPYLWRDKVTGSEGKRRRREEEEEEGEEDEEGEEEEEEEGEEEEEEVKLSGSLTQSQRRDGGWKEEERRRRGQEIKIWIRL